MDAIAKCDLLVSIGMSAVVFPAAQMPLVTGKSGAKLVEINPEPTPLSEAYDLCLREPASEAPARLCEVV